MITKDETSRIGYNKSDENSSWSKYITDRSNWIKGKKAIKLYKIESFL